MRAFFLAALVALLSGCSLLYCKDKGDGCAMECIEQARECRCSTSCPCWKRHR